MAEAQFGMIGLGTMGRNFVLNVAEHGFVCTGYDLDETKRQLLLAEGAGLPVSSAKNITEFVSSLSSPRNIMMLVPAGPIVDSVIHDLIDSLRPNDLLIDGGNSHFTDTERRQDLLGKKGVSFLGVGVSGGEHGARYGASIMVGGDDAIYQRVRSIFEAVSAKVNGEPCAAFVGRGSAGHFVKMVHNGIEYAMMQLIAETYDLLRKGFSISEDSAADLFEKWNTGELNSFLIEITSVALRKRDVDGAPLVEKILDTAGQKGTGRWTSEAALELGVPVPTIDSAVAMRQLSALKAQRVRAAEALGIAQEVQIDDTLGPDVTHFLESGLHLAFIIAYAQGLALLHAASIEKGYDLDLREITKIWRGGCIIRSKLLGYFRATFQKDPDLPNILLAENLRQTIQREDSLLKATLKFAIAAGVPCMGLSSALNYIKAYSSARLPANLIQAQRDLFGAHSYQRIDKQGTFHTPDWSS